MGTLKHIDIERIAKGTYRKEHIDIERIAKPMDYPQRQYACVVSLNMWLYCTTAFDKKK